MNNLITIDLEDYYHVSGLQDVAPREKWNDFSGRIEIGANIILEALDGVKATFFVLGWVAKKYPDLVKKISAAGHEIATHGCNHSLIDSLTRKEFLEDLRKAKCGLEDLSGKPVKGHRAPSFSVTDKTPWAFEAIAEAGLIYDSSVFPVKRRRGGISGSSLEPYLVETSFGSVIEFPLTVFDFCKRKFPAAGGGFFRLYPYCLTAKIIQAVNRSGRPAVIYLHPWEFDSDQPKLKSRLSRNGFNHYIGLKTTIKKFRKLIRDFSLISMEDYINANNCWKDN